MKIQLMNILKFVFLLLLSLSLQANEIQIVFSHSLNGNLLSCPCAIVPIAGISRRATYLQNNFSKENTIFLELGNFFSSSDSFDKRKAILDSLKELEYTAIIPSSNEWKNLTLNDWKELNREFILVSNVKEKGILRNKNLFSEKKLLTKFEKNFLILSFLSETEFLKIPNSIRKNYELISSKAYIKNHMPKEKYDYLLLVLIGNLEDFNHEDFSSLENVIYFLASFSKQSVILNSQFGKVYTSSGNFGNELGILKLNLKTKSFHFRTINLNVEQLQDSSIIKKIADKYGVKE